MGATWTPYHALCRRPKIFWLTFLVSFVVVVVVEENTRVNRNPNQRLPFFLTRGSEPAEPSPQKINLNESKILWPDDPDCSGYDVRFGHGLNNTLLLSYPRSGNTWTRYLLEAATGIFTGSVYHSKVLLSSGFFGENIPPSQNVTIVDKTHRPSNVKPDIPTIMLLRNPERSCISFFSYRSIPGRGINKHLDTIPMDELSSKEFHDFASKCRKDWLDVTMKGLTVDHLLPIYYEHLREDPISYVRLMLQFLGIQPDEGRMNCLAKYIEGQFKGGQRAIDPYTPEEKEDFRNVIATANKVLVQRGFKPLPDFSVYQNRR